MSVQSSSYIHGSSPDEQHRLSLLNDILNDACLRELSLRGGERILDRTMVRAVRPGGRVVLADDDHDLLRLWPEPSDVMPLWRAYIRTYDRLGNDPFVGRRLVSLLHAAGAAPVRNTWVFFGSCAGSPFFPAVVENMASILTGARDAIVLTARKEPAWFERGIAALKEWSARPDAAFWFALPWAEGTRRKDR